MMQRRNALRCAAAAILLAVVAAPIATSAQDSADAAAADAPAAVLVLQPPADTAAICNKETFYEFSSHYCAEAIFFYKDPDAGCCEGLAMYYGPNATKPSKNCFCDSAVWTEFISYYEKHYYDFPSFFTVCARLGYPVGFNSDGATGYCYGVPPDQETLDAARIESKSDAEQRAENYWDTAPAFFRKLHRDSWVTCSFVTGIFSGIGVLFLIWPLTVDAAISAGNAFARLRS